MVVGHSSVCHLIRCCHSEPLQSHYTNGKLIILNIYKNIFILKLFNSVIVCLGGRPATTCKMALRERFHVHNVVSPGPNQFCQHREREALFILVTYLTT